MTQGFVNPYTYAVSAPTVTTYTSGSGTYTVPSGVQFLVVEMCGGGGGGGGCGAGKGAGGNGGTTSFGSWTAIGGTGAIATNGPNNPSAPGGGGSGGASGAGTQVFRVAGASGGSGIGITSIGMTSQGPGGGSILSGGNAWFQGTANVNGLPGMGQGGGGAGAAGSDNSAAGGGGGGEQVQFIISSPAATYSYAVGAGGTAGAGAATGGTGGSGVIVIYEYYQTLGIPTTLTLPLSISNGGTGLTSAPIFSATGITTGTLNTSFNGVVYPTVSFDTTSSYNASTGIYTAPVQGRYVIYGSFSVTGGSITAGNYTGIAIAQNGNRKAINVGRAAVSSGNGTFTNQVTSILQLSAGDTVQILSVTNYGSPSYAALLEDAEFRFSVTCIGAY